MENIQQQILERIVRIETKIDGYNNLREKLDKTYGMTCNNTEDLREIKDNQKWLWRAFTGALIGSFIGSLIIWRG